MSNRFITAITAIAVATNLVPLFVAAQQPAPKKNKGELYFSWGYNTEWYTRSNVRVVQPELGNNYILKNVRAHDNRGWNEGLFSKPLTIPQYNYRLGYFFNQTKGLAIEINFDHTKYIISDQNARIKGTLGNRKSLDSSIAFNQDNGFYYYLNNGANFLLINIVKRWQLYKIANGKIKIDLLGKAGVGPVIPHVDNSLFGQANNPDFQIGGWNVGVEGAAKATFFNYIFIEFASKLDYARYAHLNVYKGRARQAFGTFELIGNLGIAVPVGKAK
jgi:hypothetical protein